MAKEALAKKSLSHLLKAISHLVQLPKQRVWLDYYDKGADMLFSTTKKTLWSLVGVTILEASQR
jgi:hypothetical protein